MTVSDYVHHRAVLGVAVLLLVLKVWLHSPPLLCCCSCHCCCNCHCLCLEASDRASSHRCQPGNVRFLDASDGASIRPCQPGNVVPALPTWSRPVPRSIRWGEHPSVEHPLPKPGSAVSVEASDGASIHRCHLAASGS